MGDHSKPPENRVQQWIMTAPEWAIRATLYGLAALVLLLIVLGVVWLGNI